jgi:TatD DNase family protein
MQQTAWCDHIAAARETGLPLIIHSRDADDDMIILRDEHSKGALYLRHALLFILRRASQRRPSGILSSMSGITAFPSIVKLRDIFAAAPIERGLLKQTASTSRPRPNVVAETSLPSPHSAQSGGHQYGVAEFCRTVGGQLRASIRCRCIWSTL